MSGDLLVLVALGSLLLFILWEIWRNRRTSFKRRAETVEGFVPGGAAQEVALFVLAAAFLTCSVLALISPDLTTSGRYGYLFGFLRSWLGTRAAPVLFLAVAAGVFVAGLSSRRRRLASTRGRHAG